MTRSTVSTALSAAAEKHLGSYALAAAAGMGALTSAEVAHAAVQSFSYAPQVLTAQGGGNTSAAFQLFTNGPTLTVKNFVSNSFVPVGAQASHGLALLGGAYATNLAGGAAISAGRTFTTVTANSRFGGDRQIGYYGSFSPMVNTGNFVNKTGYLGFKFTDPTKSTQTDFGWVRIGENYNQTQLTIYAAAYDNSGLGLLAGTTTTVPESTSVGLLAAGACGLGLWRRQSAQRRAVRGRSGGAEVAATVA